MNQNGRIIICGQIAQYNDATPPPGPNLMWCAVRRLHIHGIMGLDHSDQWQRFVDEMLPWVRDGKVRHIEDIVDGVENVPTAYLDLLAGRNRGKRLVRFAH
jgi:NADPH-dependent curcumin reductase CurA